MNQLPKYGETSGILVSDTTPWTGVASHIIAMKDSVFSKLTGTIAVASGSAWADAPLPKGMILTGVFTEVTLSSGAVVLQYKKDA